MIDKDKYIKEVEKQRADWQSDIYKLRVIAEDTGWEDPDQQIQYYRAIEDITAKESEVADMLALLKDTTKGDWPVNKDKLDQLRKEVSEAIAAARSGVP